MDGRGTTGSATRNKKSGGKTYLGPMCVKDTVSLCSTRCSKNTFDWIRLD